MTEAAGRKSPPAQIAKIATAGATGMFVFGLAAVMGWAERPASEPAVVPAPAPTTSPAPATTGLVAPAPTTTVLVPLATTIPAAPTPAPAPVPPPPVEVAPAGPPQPRRLPSSSCRSNHSDYSDPALPGDGLPVDGRCRGRWTPTVNGSPRWR